MYHGEKVAFGTLAQLVLENVPHEELEEIIMWCIEVGLPVTLEELGAGNVTDEQLMEVAKVASAEGDTLQNMPFTVTPESVFAAIKAADAYGRYYLGEEYAEYNVFCTKVTLQIHPEKVRFFYKILYKRKL